MTYGVFFFFCFVNDIVANIGVDILDFRSGATRAKYPNQNVFRKIQIRRNFIVTEVHACA